MSRSFLNSEMYRYEMRYATNDADVRPLVGRLFSPLVSQLAGLYVNYRLGDDR